MTPCSIQDGRPRIGITANLEDDEYRSRVHYVNAVSAAGAIPVLLPCIPDAIPAYLECCDAFVTTGGDDPIMEEFGVPTHEQAKKIDPRRQEFELELLKQLEQTEHPLLAICLGMQLMSLASGGTLDQFLPDSHATAELHWNGRTHMVEGVIGNGTVHSHHRQAIIDPGALEVVARAEDGLIEAVRDPRRQDRIGVQWHPERTSEAPLGALLFENLVRASAATTGR